MGKKILTILHRFFFAFLNLCITDNYNWFNRYHVQLGVIIDQNVSYGRSYL